MASYEDKAKDNFKAMLPLYLFSFYLDNDEYSDRYPSYESFMKFKVTNELISLYTTQYFQAERTELLKGKKIDDIYNFIKKYKQSKELEYKKQYLKEFGKILTRDEFKKLLDSKKCSYCGINIQEIYSLGEKGKLQNKRADTRGYTLEIDRKNPNKEYSKENICMSCYWCNNAKTDEFLPFEFKEIARGINIVWKQRLSMNSIQFPENSDIWTES
jgi:5-methylcytosine-specific restriction endonuclease McrA